jgi:hypothetical protein
MVVDLDEPPVARADEPAVQQSEQAKTDVAYDLQAEGSTAAERESISGTTPGQVPEAVSEAIPEAVIEEPGPVEAPTAATVPAAEELQPTSTASPVDNPVDDNIDMNPPAHVMREEAPLAESQASHPHPVGASVVGASGAEPPAAHAPTVETPAFDVAGFIASLPTDQQDLHRRANRVAKVTMQDIKLLKPGDVQNGREQKDICIRLRGELDKARREYDRRFRTILDHPVDYFHYWLVEILADGRGEALGEYPYPSPVLRR